MIRGVIFDFGNVISAFDVGKFLQRLFAQSKRELAAEIASVLAFSAIRNNDKVGLILFTDQVEKYIPPRKGRRHILRLIREMLLFQPRRTGTSIPSALAFLNHVIHRRSIIFLVTDFLHSFGSDAKGLQAGRDTGQEMGLTDARHDLVCVHLHDPREGTLPNAGLLTVEDAETGELLELDSKRADVRDVLIYRCQSVFSSLRPPSRLFQVSVVAREKFATG